ncbi:MAG TPA: NifB/NifX family molybdenum-iron cluster-binding protein [Patescibacteria group bacterium]|nr:NifB/NifX family molybdenum-iron cluster-binding protein [Patescibacteria group bacterium]
MKIAIASLGKKMNSILSPQAGRAPYFLIFEKEELVETWKNPFSVGGGGVGPAVARVLAEKQVEQVLVSEMGPKMQAALAEKEIDFQEMEEDTVKNVLNKVINK